MAELFDYIVSPQKEKALLIDRILFDHYEGPFHFFSNKDVISQLVSALLSHRTKNAVSGKAYRVLKTKFATWEDLLVASDDSIVNAIKEVTFPEIKAPRIKQMLQYIKDHNNGLLSLDFLRNRKISDIRAWLQKIPGVGIKTSAAALNFSEWRMPALVVDTHHLRVAQRIGLVPLKCTLEKGAKLLESYLPVEWDGQRVYDNHQAFMRHGQRLCHWKTPNCKSCVVRRHCDYYNSRFVSSN
ncbi:MAG: Fe-S cluster assembly protein HesB [Bacteroidota bacterium]